MAKGEPPKEESAVERLDRIGMAVLEAFLTGKAALEITPPNLGTQASRAWHVRIVTKEPVDAA